jgi:hypothetical protein
MTNEQYLSCSSNSTHFIQPNGFHKNLTKFSIQRKIIPVQFGPFLADPFNIILPSIPRTFKWFFPSSFPTKTCLCHYPILATYQHYFSSSYDHLNNIWQAVRITNILSVPSPPVFVTSSLLNQNIFFSTLSSIT